jgi:hypothetical protein
MYFMRRWRGILMDSLTSRASFVRSSRWLFYLRSRFWFLVFLWFFYFDSLWVLVFESKTTIVSEFWLCPILESMVWSLVIVDIAVATY